MAVTIANYEGNKIILNNSDLVNPVIYTILKLDVDGIFKAAPGFTLFPDAVLAAGAEYTVDLVSDGIYRLTVDATPDIEYLFLADSNIKKCKKEKLQKILCEDCECKECGTDYCKKVDDYLKFEILEQNFYFVYNKYIQTQSVTDLITADVSELIYFKDLLDKLSTYCGGCESGCVEAVKTSGCGC